MRVNVSFGEQPARASSKTASAPTRTALARRLRLCRVRDAVLRGSGPRPPGAACRRIRVKGAPSQRNVARRLFSGVPFGFPAPVHGLLQRVVETVSRALWAS